MARIRGSIIQRSRGGGLQRPVGVEYFSKLEKYVEGSAVRKRSSSGWA
jgi:hypothetical protein